MYWSLTKLSPPPYRISPRGFCFLRTYLRRSWPETTLNSRDAAQAVGRGSPKAHVLPVCVGFSSPSGRCRQIGKLPHPLLQASACLLSVAKAWSAGISRTLDFLVCIARQGWQQAGDRESGLWGGGAERNCCSSV